jgi:hypothetical protein
MNSVLRRAPDKQVPRVARDFGRLLFPVRQLIAGVQLREGGITLRDPGCDFPRLVRIEFRILSDTRYAALASQLFIVPASTSPAC